MCSVKININCSEEELLFPSLGGHIKRKRVNYTRGRIIQMEDRLEIADNRQNFKSNKICVIINCVKFF